MNDPIIILAIYTSAILFVIVSLYFLIALPFMLTVDPAIDSTSKIGKFIHGLMLTIKFSWYSFISIWFTVTVYHLYNLIKY